MALKGFERVLERNTDHGRMRKKREEEREGLSKAVHTDQKLGVVTDEEKHAGEEKIIRAESDETRRMRTKGLFVGNENGKEMVERKGEEEKRSKSEEGRRRMGKKRISWAEKLEEGGKTAKNEKVKREEENRIVNVKRKIYFDKKIVLNVINYTGRRNKLS